MPPHLSVREPKPISMHNSFYSIPRLVSKEHVAKVYILESDIVWVF